MDRKEFFFTCSGSMLFAMTAELLEGCAKIYYAAADSSDKKIKVALSEFVSQDKSGQTIYRKFVLVKNDQLNFPIVIYRKAENKFTALYTECSHRGCELNPAPNGLQCPCHGSEFSEEGKVLNPPAERDLRQFPVQVEKDFITIELI